MDVTSTSTSKDDSAPYNSRLGECFERRISLMRFRDKELSKMDRSQRSHDPQNSLQSLKWRGGKFQETVLGSILIFA